MTDIILDRVRFDCDDGGGGPLKAYSDSAPPNSLPYKCQQKIYLLTIIYPKIHTAVSSTTPTTITTLVAQHLQPQQILLHNIYNRDNHSCTTPATINNLVPQHLRP